MEIEALYINDLGREVLPQTAADWQQWVAAGATRNYLLKDPLLDWLKLYGDAKGFSRDTLADGYDSRTDMMPFLMEKGGQFEAAVIRCLADRASIVTICEDFARIRELSVAEETFRAMADGVEIIHQGVLRDPQTRTYGAPDLLIRSDVIDTLFPGALRPGFVAIAAPGLPSARWHYIVVYIKFTTLHLLASGLIGNGGAAAYKAQVFIYNRALGRLQGFTPPRSFLLGRGWEQTIGGATERGRSCFERLGPVEQDQDGKAGSLAEQVEEAVAWIRRVRSEGAAWQVLPRPTIPELWPNMGNTSDAPWHGARGTIADQLNELTLLWNVGPDKRWAAHDRGVFGWRDSACTAFAVDVLGPKQAPTLQALLDINRSAEGPAVLPSRVHAEEVEWRATPPLEFYVDFETVSDLDDDFSRLPEKGGQPLIFMVGCGHIEDGEWSFQCFIADRLDEPAEAVMIDAWLEHMEEIRRRLAPEIASKLIHWSHHEKSTLEEAYNAAIKRHPEKNWSPQRWFDFLTKVFRAEPVVVRGALGFGLKPIARALHAHGLIETSWSDGPGDGLGAMVGAWWCEAERRRVGGTLPDLELMRQIAAYNEVDCKVMSEIVQLLREQH